MPTEILFGFLGLIVGAGVGFAADMIVNNRRMRFEAYKDVKKTLSTLHTKLINGHSKILQFYNENGKNNSIEDIIALKDYHWELMELYKEYRVYFGDLKAYELQSAIYEFYYQYAKHEEDNVNNNFFFYAYQALKDGYGLLISEVKLGLISVKFIKTADRNLNKSRTEDYDKYTSRLSKTLTDDVHNKINQNYEFEAINNASKVLKERIDLYQIERNEKNKFNKNK